MVALSHQPCADCGAMPCAWLGFHQEWMFGILWAVTPVGCPKTHWLMGSSTHGAHPAACDYGAGNKQDDNLIYHVFGLRTGAAEYDSPFLTRFLFVVLLPHPFARREQKIQLAKIKMRFVKQDGMWPWEFELFHIIFFYQNEGGLKCSMKVVLGPSSAAWTPVPCELDWHIWAGMRWWLLMRAGEGPDCSSFVPSAFLLSHLRNDM